MSSRAGTGPTPVHSGSICMPNVVLRYTLKASGDRLHYCHVNAGSIPPKIDEFRSCFEGTRLDIVVASETWLKSYHSDKLVELSGFTAIRNDRYAKRSGGVILYIRENLNYKLLKVSEKVSSEFLFIEVIFPDCKILVGAYYKAPKVRELDVFEDVLLELSVSYDDILLLGDFNENYLGSITGECSYCASGSCSKCEFASIVDRFGLVSAGDIPSHYPIGERPSLIDLCLTNRPEKIVFFNQVSHGLSKHDIIFGSYSCDKRSLGKEPMLTRNFARVDMGSLSLDAGSIGWGDVFDAVGVNDKIEVFNRKVLSLLDAHAPLKPFTREKSLTSIQPWFTDEIRRALLERDVAEFEYRHHRVTKAHYHRLRNVATNLIKKVKHDYMQPKLDVRLGSKALWRNLRDIGAVSSSNVKPEFTASEFN